MLVLLAVVAVPVAVGLLCAYISYCLQEQDFKAQTLRTRDVMLAHESDIDALYNAAMHVPTSFNQADLSDIYDDDVQED